MAFGREIANRHSNENEMKNIETDFAFIGTDNNYKQIRLNL